MAEHVADGDTWRHPTEAEMKIIEARRERSNKISKLMGEYLLRGYKMLSSSCTECGTILLQDRSQEDYCITCSELTSDVCKDDPALSNEAARRQVAEQQTTAPPIITNEAAQPSTSSIPTVITADSSRTSEDIRDVTNVVTTPLVTTSTDTVLKNAQSSVEAKLVWVSQELRKASGAEACIELCRLIRGCAEAISALADAQKNCCR